MRKKVENKRKKNVKKAVKNNKRMMMTRPLPHLISNTLNFICFLFLFSSLICCMLNNLCMLYRFLTIPWTRGTWTYHELNQHSKTFIWMISLSTCLTNLKIWKKKTTIFAWTCLSTYGLNDLKKLNIDES